MRWVARSAAIGVLLPLFVALWAVSTAQPAMAAGTCTGSFTVTCTFSPTGAEQTFTVPSGVSSLHVVLTGGSGGAGSAAAGRGGVLEADVPVSEGSQLFVEVGGNGTTIQVCCEDPTPGGFNGGGLSHPIRGGSGGGASDIRTVSRTETGSLGSRLVVAGGGGGGGGNAFAAFAGNGGDAGQLEGATGANGADDTDDGTTGGTGGGGGTQTVGGDGGVGNSSSVENGADGAQGTGGAGGEAIGAAGGGGGGGGGYFGGGGAGGGEAVSAGGGGGGGSSFAVSAATVDSFTLDGTQSPSIVITYTVPDQHQTSLFSVQLPSGRECRLEAKLVRIGAEASASTTLLSTEPECADPTLRTTLRYKDANGQLQRTTVVAPTSGPQVASATDVVRIVKTTHIVSFPACGGCGTTVTMQPK